MLWLPLATSVLAWTVPSATLAGLESSTIGRRAVVSQVAALASALPFALVANADSDLTMSDLGLDVGKGVAASVGDLSADDSKPLTITMVTLDGSAKKAKKDTPASRIKELSAKKDLTDKEKKVCGSAMRRYRCGACFGWYDD
jgi:hypothetical protein